MTFDLSPTSYIIGALRFFLRTPLEQAGLKAYPAAHRLLDCIEDHLDAFPQDKEDIEDLMRIIGAGVTATPKFAPTPPDPPAPNKDYPGAHGGSIYTGPNRET